jgi:long-chain acyl-CoA synthetase
MTATAANATTTEPARGKPSGSFTEAATLPGVLLQRVRNSPDAVALRKKQLGRWKPYTWSDYAERVARVAAGLQALGVRPGDRVAIQSDNRPAWVFVDLAVQALGAVCVGVYPTSPAAEVQYVLRHSGASVLVAEDEEQLDKALEVWHEVPTLRHIVIVDTRGIDVGSRAGLLSYEHLEELGKDGTIEWLTSCVSYVNPTQTAIIVYTSGTTGPPKGAMLSHTNLLTAARASHEVFALGPKDEVLSYLPLCHIAERLLSVVDALAAGYIVNYGEGGESFLTDLQEVQPTFFLGVPRVWEKLMASVEIRMRDASRIKRGVYRWAHKRGTAVARKRMAGSFGPVQKVGYLLLWLTCFRPLRKKLGLLRVKQALSGAAPVAPQVLEFYWALGVPVREAYGQTENTALATIVPSGDVRIGTVGRPYPGVEIRIAPDGEILTRGPGTFLGYYNDPEATRATFDPEGWLLTGDVGVLDRDGFLTITDRKKDLIVTAGGKNVSPSEIEGMLKVSPFIREAIVVGDRRPYLVALIGIEGDTVADWAAHQRLRYTTYEDLSARPEVVELIGREVERSNAALAQVETIKRFALLPKELDQQDGEVTATQKVKRAAIAHEFEKMIESLYESEGAPSA